MLDDALRTALLHLQRAQSHAEEVRQYKLTDPLHADSDKLKTLDAFIFRFIKLQDYMSDKLFRSFLTATGDYQRSMSQLDVLDKMEQLEMIHEVDEWIRIRQLRNQLTHEYPDNQAEILQGIQAALERMDLLSQTLTRIQNYCLKHQLIDKNPAS